MRWCENKLSSSCVLAMTKTTTNGGQQRLLRCRGEDMNCSRQSRCSYDWSKFPTCMLYCLLFPFVVFRCFSPWGSQHTMIVPNSSPWLQLRPKCSAKFSPARTGRKGYLGRWQGTYFVRPKRRFLAISAKRNICICFSCVPWIAYHI